MDNIPEQVEVLIEEGVKIVTTGAGTPKPYLERLKQANIKVFPVIPSVKLAQKTDHPVKMGQFFKILYIIFPKKQKYLLRF